MKLKTPKYHYDDELRKYVLDEDVRYYSPRYKKFVYLKKGFPSDGATRARDIRSLSWWVHDWFCDYGVWSDGFKCTNWQASMVLSDILAKDGRWVRSKTWFISTWLFGGGKARQNGMW